MQQGAVRVWSREPRRSIVYLGLLILARAIVQAVLYTRGFISVAADEFFRGIVAAQWALEPRFDLATDLTGAWLPFEKYLNGSLLRLWPDAILIPRLTVFVASCLLLVAFFLLVRYLFRSFWVAALASLFAATVPWFVWLSGTPMLEMYYLAFFFWGLLLLAVWLREARRGYWFWAGCCFMLASGFHVQSWILINTVNLLTVGCLYRYLRQGRTGQLWRLIGFYLLGNALILAGAILGFASTGQLFAFFADHTSYSKWFYDGYNASIAEKLLYYPRLVAENSSAAVWVLALLALVLLWRDEEGRWKVLPLLLAGVVLAVYSVMNIFAVPATAAPARYSMFYVVMLSPYLAYGVWRLVKRVGWPRWGSSSGPTRDTDLRGSERLWKFGRLGVFGLAVLSVGLFSYGFAWGVARIPDYPRAMALDAVETGRRLNEVLGRSGFHESETYMVELRFWDYLAVQLTAGYYDRIVFDREYDLRDRDMPSIFGGEVGDIYANLASQQVRYVALRDPELKAVAGVTGYLRPEADVGGWTIYEFLAGSQVEP
jgi:hypothetical protein